MEQNGCSEPQQFLLCQPYPTLWDALRTRRPTYPIRFLSLYQFRIFHVRVLGPKSYVFGTAQDSCKGNVLRFFRSLTFERHSVEE